MKNLVILICLFIAEGRGCRDTLWFQVSTLGNLDDVTSGKYHLQTVGKHENLATLQAASRFVSSPTECARICYVSMANICGSAVLDDQHRNGLIYCRLMPWKFPCAIGRNLFSSAEYRGGIMLLHCFYCNRFAGGGKKEEEEVIDNGEEFPVVSTPMPESERVTPSSTVSPTIPSTRSRSFDLIPNPRPTTTPTSIIIRMMTFNSWIAGKNVRDGVLKIARHIRAKDPHVVGLQEMDEFTAFRIKTTLNTLYQQDGRPQDVWYHCRRNEGNLNHILTRLPIVQEYEPSVYLKNNGCQLKIADQPPRFVQIWNVHLHWETYGPYAACGWARNRSPRMTTTSVENLLLASEYKPRDQTRSRLHQALRFIHHRPLRDAMIDRGSTVPLVVVMGDFNSPSHLDWINSASWHHCNVSYEWPVSKLMTDSGFVDSFRRVNYDPWRDPGFTWSPIYKMKTWVSLSSDDPEPQDRIDFIYYLGGNPRVRVLRSWVYKGDGELGLFPYHRDNDWPSDHASVVADFEVNLA